MLWSCEKGGYSFDIEVDGGVDNNTIAACAKAGANVFVAGSTSSKILIWHRKFKRFVMLSMPKIALFVGGELEWFATDFDYFVGVDRACLRLLELGLPLDLAAWDFDSVSRSELEMIQSAAKIVWLLQLKKDDTDTELALKIIFQLYPEAEVTIFGAFGGRIDHMLSNIFLVSDPELAPFYEAYLFAR